MTDNRRTFLKAGAALATGELLNLNPRVIGANEKVNLALIGGRNQGRGVALRAVQAGARFKTFCDLDPAILDKVGADITQAQGEKPQFEKDFRRVLEGKIAYVMMVDRAKGEKLKAALAAVS